jgi:outer membrane assembly lipoprotein YfiO
LKKQVLSRMSRVYSWADLGGKPLTACRARPIVRRMNRTVLAWGFLIGSLAAMSCPAQAPAPLPPQPAEAAVGDVSLGLFLRPAKDAPDEQFQHARTLQGFGKHKAADRQFRALVKKWPAAPEAAFALFEHGRYLEDRGRHERAFAVYQMLVDEYPGRFPYQDVLESQFRIAVHVMTRKKAPWLFGGYKTPEEAIPYLKAVVQNGPTWERAPLAQFLIGKAYEESGNLSLAVPEYLAAELRYPDTPQAEEAAFRKAVCLVRLSEKSPNDTTLLTEASAAVGLFLKYYPESDHAVEARLHQDRLVDRHAEKAFRTAEFYDRVSRNREAALRSYRKVIERYPRSEWTLRAERRIVELTGEAS